MFIRAIVLAIACGWSAAAADRASNAMPDYR